MRKADAEAGLAPHPSWKAESDMKMIPLILAAAVLSACASVPDTAVGVRQAVTVEQDRFDQAERFKGPALSRGGFLSNGLWYLRSAPEGVESGHEIYVQWTKTGPWPEFHTATFSGGDSVRVLNIGKFVASCGVQGCYRAERAAVPVERARLREADAAGRGLDVKLRGEGEDEIEIRIPAHYVEGYLAAVEAG